MRFTRPIHRKREHRPSIRIPYLDRHSQDDTWRQFFTQKKLDHLQFAEYYRKLAFKHPVIPTTYWPDVILALMPLGKIVAMSAKQGIILYKGKRENYMNRNVEEVFDELGPRVRAFGEEVWRHRRMKAQEILINKGGNCILKRLLFCPLQDLTIICAEHLLVCDHSQSLFGHPVVG
ncbi:MAG: hypothetical protein NW701_17900 [Nitrospira sp.]